MSVAQRRWMLYRRRPVDTALLKAAGLCIKAADVYATIDVIGYIVLPNQEGSVVGKH
jgi:hypothetical protein